MRLETRRVARTTGRTLAWSWVAFVTTYVVAGLATRLAAGDAWPPASIVRFLPATAWFTTLLFAASLVATSPAWAALALGRRRLGMRGCAVIGALLFAAWGEWWTCRMEWFDVWRHGVPDWRYALTVLLPVALAWGTGGWVLGSAIGRSAPAERTQPA